MSLHRLDSGDGLQSIEALYGVHKRILLRKKRKICKAIRNYLQLVFVQTPSES